MEVLTEGEARGGKRGGGSAGLSWPGYPAPTKPAQVGPPGWNMEGGETAETRGVGCNVLDVSMLTHALGTCELR